MLQDSLQDDKLITDCKDIKHEQTLVIDFHFGQNFTCLIVSDLSRSNRISDF